MRSLLFGFLILLLAGGCASTSSLRINEDVYTDSEECLYYPYTCMDYIDPWYGLYPYDWWYYGDHDHYYYYPRYDHHYPYYLWRHHRPKHKKPRYAKEGRYKAGERTAHIRNARQEARRQRIINVRQARQHRIEIRRQRANSFRSTFQRSRPAQGFKGSFGGFRRR